MKSKILLHILIVFLQDRDCRSFELSGNNKAGAIASKKEWNLEVLSLIVSGCGDADFSKVYSRIMSKIETIYGSNGKRKPISVKRLKIKSSLQRINREMQAKLGSWKFPDFLKSVAISMFGEFYLRNTKNGKFYLQKLVELSDNLTLDGRINTVITGNPAQRENLFRYLDKLENLELIKYGIPIGILMIRSFLMM